MSEAQEDPPANQTGPGSHMLGPDPTSAPASGAHGEPSLEYGTDNSGDLGGHTSLSRPAAPQGRRSLFRR